MEKRRQTNKKEREGRKYQGNGDIEREGGRNLDRSVFSGLALPACTLQLATYYVRA